MILLIFLHTSAILLLTVITQVGGLAYGLTLLTVYFLVKNRKLSLFIFLCFYSLISFGSSYVAPIFGRVPLPCFASGDIRLAMQSPLYCALNRHYVTPEMKQTAFDLASHMNDRFPRTTTIALDGNFPFFDRFPLLPHLSHHDGRKLDFAFYYKDKDGQFLNGVTKSPIGYWAFERPEKEICQEKPFFKSLRWDVAWFEPLNRDYRLDDDRMKSALNWINTTGRDHGLTKAFIEPHLAEKYNISGGIFKFQGCHAARHDDHIHVQF